MKTRIIHTKFWADDYISDLSPLEKLVFIYYLTNDRVNIIHCFECPDKYVLVDTGVSREVLQRCKDKFQTDNKMRFYNGYVQLLNAGKFERYVGEDNEKKKAKLLEEMSVDVLSWYNNKNNTPVERDVTPVYTGTINHNTEIININHNKGGVGGIEISEQKIQEIADRYQVPVAFVKSKYEDMILWKEQQPSNAKLRGRNWEMTLRNWVKRDAVELRKEALLHGNKRGIDATGI